jgi:hypothetical protein
VLKRIAGLYAVEKDARGQLPDERVRLRQARAKPSQIPAPAVWNSLIECSDQSCLNSPEFAFLAENSELSKFEFFNGIRGIADLRWPPIGFRKEDAPEHSCSDGEHEL